MESSARPPSFTFRIVGADSQPGNAVPAAVLVQILQSAQQAFELIGVHVEGRSIRERARIGVETSQRFQLQCRVPAAGSYVMPVTVGAAGELFRHELADRALWIFRELMQGISSRTSETFVRSLPDERIRRRVLESVKGMAPRPGSPWVLHLEGEPGVAFATLDKHTVPFLQEALVPANQRQVERVVTGELKNIDFIEHRLKIIYPPTSKELDCYYEEELEDLLFEKRRDLIQVTGRVILDDNGQPKQIVDVTDIRDVDLGELPVVEVRTAGRRIRARKPVALDVYLDESKQLLCVEDETIGVSAFSSTREGLVRELESQIGMLWSEYALAADDDLDGAARELKRALLAHFSESGNAT